jgi:hypothetical protein
VVVAIQNMSQRSNHEIRCQFYRIQRTIRIVSCGSESQNEAICSKAVSLAVDFQRENNGKISAEELSEKLYSFVVEKSINAFLLSWLKEKRSELYSFDSGKQHPYLGCVVGAQPQFAVQEIQKLHIREFDEQSLMPQVLKIFSKIQKLGKQIEEERIKKMSSSDSIKQRQRNFLSWQNKLLRTKKRKRASLNP